MKSADRTSSKGAMSADAYAGFLKLWLTPASSLPRRSPEIEAYLRHVSESEPLSDDCRQGLGQVTYQAA